jgi:hypothetical protein
MEIRIQCLRVDSAEPKKIASFWEAALGWRRTFDEDDQVCIERRRAVPKTASFPTCCSCVFRRAARQSQ